jgi:hypothetical protein
MIDHNIPGGVTKSGFEDGVDLGVSGISRALG